MKIKKLLREHDVPARIMVDLDNDKIVLPRDSTEFYKEVLKKISEEFLTLEQIKYGSVPSNKVHLVYTGNYYDDDNTNNSIKRITYESWDTEKQEYVRELRSVDDELIEKRTFKGVYSINPRDADEVHLKPREIEIQDLWGKCTPQIHCLQEEYQYYNEEVQVFKTSLMGEQH